MRSLHRGLLITSGSALASLACWLAWSQFSMPAYDIDHAGYLVDTPACKLPKFSPYDASIAKFLKHPSKLTCNKKNLPSLTYTEDFTIRVDLEEEVLRSYEAAADEISCCFKEIMRVEESLKQYTRQCDNKFKMSDCHPIVNGRSNVVSTEGALVVCHKSNESTPFYKNVHYFFHRDKVQKKIDKFSKLQKSGQPLPLNIILMGIDSTSRQNFERFLPKTFEFLSEDPATLDFLGYNKVADNTDPNISPIIMGNRAEDLSAFKLPCYKSRYDNFDDCPFIWKKFSAKGYATVYAEDATKIGLFHFNKIGFVKKPTDFYARPYIMASEKEMGNNKYNNKYVCIGHQLSAEVIYDQILRALDNFSGSLPVFGFFWTSSITHEQNEKAAVLDSPTLKFLQTFFASRHRNNTIILFFGDHGMRFGKIRSTYLGALEERLPFVKIILPLWFPKEFQHTWQNLVTNQRRLTNNYDLHSTLLDILEGSYKVSKDPKSPFGYGQSLFMEAPTNRTCESIHIPFHYCACQSSEPIQVDDASVQVAARILTDAINQRLEGNPGCASLKLEEVLGARIHKHDEEFAKKTLISERKKWRTYTLMVQTTPGGGQFESSLLKKDATWTILNDISRINLYGNQSYCVDDSILKMFCYCKSFIQQ